jgi:acyl-CoA thioesterase-1
LIMQCYLRRLLRTVFIGGLCVLLMANHSLAGEAPHSRTILVLGDSISAAYGMDLQQGWVQLLTDRLAPDETSWEVVNASISGETTAGGLSRLPRLLDQHRPSVVIIELGGNDGLRGYPIDQLRSNLEQLVSLSSAAGASSLLLPMEIPPNFGPRYTQMFRESFQQVAASTGAKLGGFMLEGVAIDASLMQADGIHPTAEAQPALLENVWSDLRPLLAAEVAE